MEEGYAHKVASTHYYYSFSFYIYLVLVEDGQNSSWGAGKQCRVEFLDDSMAIVGSETVHIFDRADLLY